MIAFYCSKIVYKPLCFGKNIQTNVCLSQLLYIFVLFKPTVLQYN